MNTAYILLGGNLGDRNHNLQQAAQLIAAQCGNIIQTSAMYQTAAWGLKEQPDFYNQVLQLETTSSPGILMQQLLNIEESMGRKRVLKFGPRKIDLDILLIDDVIISTTSVTIPHPLLAERRFALTPLAEIAADVMHPVLHQSIQQLLNNCTDKLPVYKI